MRFETLRRSPVWRMLAFQILPVSYYLLDVVNYSQAGKVILMSFLFLSTLALWRELVPHRRRLFTWLLTFSAIVFGLFLGFHGLLRSVFGVEQDSMVIMGAIFDSDPGEAKEFLQQYYGYLLYHLLAVGGFLFVFIRFVIRDSGIAADGKVAPRLRHAAYVFTALLVGVHLNPSMRLANPLFYMVQNFTEWQRQIAALRSLRVTLARAAARGEGLQMSLAPEIARNTVVLVIGESDTRKNWSLYGYPRNTTPRLQQLRDQLVVFRQVASADGSTIGSVTKMLSPATLERPFLWTSQPNIVWLARQLGYKVFWITNNGIAKRGVISALAEQADVAIFTNKGRSRGEGSFDEAVFPAYEAALRDRAAKKLIIVNLLGAHPAYNFRYPRKYSQFELNFSDAVATELKRAGRPLWAIAFRNMYDCAILYQDYVLSRLLTRLQAAGAERASWLYVADHGQDVAHNSSFSGHNRRVRQMWQVPMLLWRRGAGENLLPRVRLEGRAYQADVLDHTLLGLLGARGTLYDGRFDILSTLFDPALNRPKLPQSP